MSWYPSEPWVDISPWRIVPLPIRPVPPPIKHMRYVKDMTKNRKSICRIDAPRPRPEVDTRRRWR